jgi:hypothetical protein
MNINKIFIINYSKFLTSIKKNLIHFIVASIFVSLLCVSFRDFLFNEITFQYRDLIWPFDITELISSINYSINLDGMRRLLYLGPLFYILNYFGGSSILAEKSLFIIVRFMLSFLPYIVTFKFLNTKFNETNKVAITAVSVFAGFFYAYNPFQTTLISTAPNFSFSYSLIPLIFYYYDKALSDSKFSSVFLTGLLIALSIAGVIQFLVLLPMTLLLPWLLFTCIKNKNNRITITLLKRSFLILLFVFLFSLYWFLPTVFINLEGKATRPDYVLNQTMLNTFSKPLIDSFRLMGDWLPDVPLTPHVVPEPIWQILSFVTPLTILVFMLTSKKTKFHFHIIAFSLLSLFVVFFIKGTQYPLPELYPNLYDIPFVGWLFRVPSKFSVFLPFFYSMVLALGAYNILISKFKFSVFLKYVPIIVVAVSISIISWPMFTGSLGGAISSEGTPSHIFMNIARGIKEDNTKAFVAPPNEAISINIPTSHNVADQYFNFISSDLEENTNIHKLLVPLNVSHLILDRSLDIADHHLVENELNYSSADINSTLLDKYRLFKINEINSPIVYKEIMMIFGGLDKLRVLSDIDSFSPSTYGVFFGDQMKRSVNFTNFHVDKLIYEDASDIENRLIMNDKDAILITPFDVVKDIKPEFKWAKAATNDPLHGSFHATLNTLGITNWDFDYSYGIISTFAKDSLKIPFSTQKESKYRLFVRLLENEKGGEVEFYIDNAKIKSAYSKKSSEKFIWSDLGVVSLNSGKHELLIKNNNGFNAINLFLLIPDYKIPSVKEQLDHLVKHTKTIYLTKGEFSNDLGKEKKIDYLIKGVESNFTKIISGDIYIPEGSTQASIQFWTKENPQKTSQYQAKLGELIPHYEKKLIKSSLGWFTKDNKRSDIIIKDNYKLEQNTIGTKIILESGSSKDWQIITTDFIPATENVLLDYQVTLICENVNGLHSKVFYFDEDKKMIKTEITSSSIQGTINQDIEKKIITPLGTKFIKLAFFIKNNSDKESSFFIKNVDIEQTISNVSLSGNSFLNMHQKNQQLSIRDDEIIVNIQKGNNKYWNVIMTKPFPVIENTKYHYSFNVKGENTNSFHIKMYYFTDDTKIIKSPEALGGNVLRLNKGSKIFTDLDLMKNSTYTVAARVKVCPECSQMTIKLGDSYENLELNNNSTAFKWFYFSTNQTMGKENLSFYSDGNTDLDTVLVYSDSNVNETIERLLSNNDTQRVSVNEVVVINPTKYKVLVSAKAPFLLSLPEKFDPMWTAKVDGMNFPSLPLYSSTNGFWINKSGTFEIILDYDPQQWFSFGMYLTIITILLSIAYILTSKTKATMLFSKLFTRNKFRNTAELVRMNNMTFFEKLQRKTKFFFFIRAPAVEKIMHQIEKYKDIPILISIILLCFVIIEQIFQNPIANELMIFVFYLATIGLLINLGLFINDKPRIVNAN